MTDRATNPTGEHPHGDVVVGEETKLPLKFVLSIIGGVIALVLAWGALTAKVTAQETRVNSLERVTCAIAKKLDVIVAECSGN